MAAPEYVPAKPMDDVRTYESPPRRPDPWIPRRPGELGAGNPRGVAFGNQGPDQGYGLILAKRLAGKVILQTGEELDDVIAGCLGVGLKRASILGRAPIIHDMTAAYTIWGFLDPSPDPALVHLRKSAFDECASPSHYGERRRIVAAVRDDAVRKPHTTITDHYGNDWRSQLDRGVLAPAAHG